MLPLMLALPGTFKSVEPSTELTNNRCLCGSMLFHALWDIPNSLRGLGPIHLIVRVLLSIEVALASLMLLTCACARPFAYFPRVGFIAFVRSFAQNAKAYGRLWFRLRKHKNTNFAWHKSLPLL